MSIEYFEIPEGNPFGYNLELYFLQDLGSERIDLLTSLDEASSKFPHFSEEWVHFIRTKLIEKDVKNLFLDQSETNTKERLYDIASHLLLRAAICDTECIEKFVKSETQLLQYRFLQMEHSKWPQYFKRNNLKLEECLPAYLVDLLFCDGKEKIYFYKFPFTEVCNLVCSRSVYLKNGFAYVSASDIHHFVAENFSNKLRKQVKEDERLFMEIKSDPENRYTKSFNLLKNSYKSQLKVVTPASYHHLDIDVDKIDDYCEENFPLCMKMMHRDLRNKHHLKYNARQEYGIFLKGAGVTVEQSLDLFREEYTKSMTDEKFDKRYGYYIKYHYGLVGGKIDHQPMSCQKIIDNSNNGQPNHGCPFNNYTFQDLQRKFPEINSLQTKYLGDIEDLTTRGKCEEACSIYFKSKNFGTNISIYSPNQFFSESVHIHNTTL